MTSSVYVVVGSKPWNRHVFETSIRQLPGEWHFVGSRDALTRERLTELAPRYVFFLHWSWIVPDALVDQFECVNFHMTDVPFGRGGSPLQNLIERGHHHSALSALRMTPELDAGPVYAKEDLCLQGTAEQVYIRSSQLAARMIGEIVASQPQPQPQEGDVTLFRRRREEDSALPESGTLERLHDFIRMLDADGYPPAVLRHGPFVLRLRRSALYDRRIVADVEITLADVEGDG